MFKRVKELHVPKLVQQGASFFIVFLLVTLGVYLFGYRHGISSVLTSESDPSTLATTSALPLEALNDSGLHALIETPDGSESGATGGSSSRGTYNTLGLYDGDHSQTGSIDFASWLGNAKTLAYSMDFLDATSWSTISNPSWFMSQWQGKAYTMVWGVPMMPCGSPSTFCSPNSTTFDQVAAGTDNSYYVSLAQSMVAGGQGSSFIRLGWEFQGDWFPWSTCNTDGANDFVSAYRNIVTSMRSVAGQDFKFIWNPDNSTNTTCPGQIENFYPGDSYVNVVALDVYDTNGGSTTPQVRWQDLRAGIDASGWTATAPESIAGQTFKGYGLDWLKAFGDQHSKLIGLPEWGLWNDGSSASGGDDTYFIDQMANWIKTNASGPANFWDYGSSLLNVPNVSSGNNLSASIEFQKDFGN